MSTFELERLGLVDLSNEKDALTQVVGGRRSAGATLVSYNNPSSGNTAPGRITETTDAGNVVNVYQISGTDTYYIGNLNKQSNGTFSGSGSYGKLASGALYFDNYDTVRWEGLK